MKIQNVNFLHSKSNFKANYSKSENKKKNYIIDNSVKIKKDTIVIAAAGGALAAYCLVKNNVNFNKIVTSIKKTHSDKITADPIIEKLNGRRDAEAVKLYNSYKAKEKSASLCKKVLNGEFDKKPKEIFQHLIENEKKLERTVRFAV